MKFYFACIVITTFTSKRGETNTVGLILEKLPPNFQRKEFLSMSTVEKSISKPFLIKVLPLISENVLPAHTGLIRSVVLVLNSPVFRLNRFLNIPISRPKS